MQDRLENEALETGGSGAVGSDWESAGGTTEPVPPEQSSGSTRGFFQGQPINRLPGTHVLAGGLERQGSIVHRERMIAHSTALESITMDVVDHNPMAPTSGAGGVGVASHQPSGPAIS